MIKFTLNCYYENTERFESGTGRGGGEKAYIGIEDRAGGKGKVVRIKKGE